MQPKYFAQIIDLRLTFTMAPTFVRRCGANTIPEAFGRMGFVYVERDEQIQEYAIVRWEPKVWSKEEKDIIQECFDPTYKEANFWIADNTSKQYTGYKITNSNKMCAVLPTGAKVLGVLEKMDWSLLRQQKSRLISEAVTNPDAAWEGLVHLLDAIQDMAVNTLGKREEEVFDTTVEDVL